MKDKVLFSFERFSSLAGSDLVEYVEPYLTIRPEAVPVSVYEQLVSGLADWDEYHLVYALELGMRLDPADFVGRLVPFLSHQDGSVCYAAYRLIKNRPPNETLDDLISEIVSVPVVELFYKDPRSGEPRRIGTNEAFLRDLVGKTTLESGTSAMV